MNLITEDWKWRFAAVARMQELLEGHGLNTIGDVNVRDVCTLVEQAFRTDTRTAVEPAFNATLAMINEMNDHWPQRLAKQGCMMHLLDPVTDLHCLWPDPLPAAQLEPQPIDLGSLEQCFLLAYFYADNVRVVLVSKLRRLLMDQG